MNSRIKAVIFDWGGVLIDEITERVHDYISKKFGMPRKDFDILIEKIAKKFHKGEITEQDIWKNINKEGNLWEEAFEKSYSPRQDVFTLAKELRDKGFKTALLSNTSLSTIKLFKRRHSGLFNTVIFSCEVGCIKPYSKIYKICLKMLEVNPKEVIFIDDKEENVGGARKLGINTILFQSAQQLRKDLSEILGNNL